MMVTCTPDLASYLSNGKSGDSGARLIIGIVLAVKGAQDQQKSDPYIPPDISAAKA